MSTSGPRYHIPFPTAFLSLNPSAHKRTGSNGSVTSPDAEVTPHNFLSNRPIVPRHSSVSSATSDSAVSVGGAPSSPPTKVADSPVLEQKVPAFLALNSKFVAPPTTAGEMSVEKSPFLSNKK